MSIRLGFCGPSGSGKSTLAAYVAERYDLPLCPVGSRSVAKAMGFASPYDVDAAGQRGVFQARLLREKKQWEAQHESFVTDRTHLDNLAYTMLHGVDSITDEYYASVLDGMKRYTYVLHCPVDSFCRPDGDPQRRQEPVYHHLYDAALVGLLAQTGHVGFVPVSDLDERKRFVDGLVQSAGKLEEIGFADGLINAAIHGFSAAEFFRQGVENAAVKVSMCGFGAGGAATGASGVKRRSTDGLNETERHILRKRGVLR